MTTAGQVERSVYQTGSFGELQDSAIGWDQRYTQLAPGRFSGRLEMVQVGARQIFRESWGLKLRYQGTAPTGSFGLALPLHQAGTGNWIGNTTTLDTVIVQMPGKEADMVSPQHWDAFVLGVPEDEIDAIAMALSADETIKGKLHGATVLQPEVSGRLRLMGLDFLRRVEAAAPQDDAEIERFSEQVVKLFVWELIKHLEGTDMAGKPGKPAKIVKQATDLALADRANTIGLTDLCTGLGISLRSLYYAFADVTGMSPANWLRTIRLNRVHETLLRATPETLLVKQVAIDNGFFHLGHFTKQYKRLFDCLPTETLRRQ